MNALATPDDVPCTMPGELRLDSTGMDWAGLKLKSYRLLDSHVRMPAMRDYLIISYQGSDAATMSRQHGGAWKSGAVRQGDVSLLTRAEQSLWRWDRPIDVSHLYVTQQSIANVASAVFEEQLCDIEMEDVVSAEDRVLPALLGSLEQELRTGGLGGKLYVEAVRTQICVHLLRRYAHVVYREASYGRLSPGQRQRLVAYVDEHIARPISLEDLAAQVPTHVPRLIRMFRAEFGCPPYAWVLRRRVEHAQRLLRSRADQPLKAVAADCGFSDQSHMTRVFQRLLSITPGEYRRATSGRACEVEAVVS